MSELAKITLEQIDNGWIVRGSGVLYSKELDEAIVILKKFAQEEEAPLPAPKPALGSQPTKPAFTAVGQKQHQTVPAR